MPSALSAGSRRAAYVLPLASCVVQILDPDGIIARTVTWSKWKPGGASHPATYDRTNIMTIIREAKVVHRLEKRIRCNSKSVAGGVLENQQKEPSSICSECHDAVQ